MERKVGKNIVHIQQGIRNKNEIIEIEEEEERLT